MVRRDSFACPTVQWPFLSKEYMGNAVDLQKVAAADWFSLMLLYSRKVSRIGFRSQRGCVP
jgi:hypothetical protein